MASISIDGGPYANWGGLPAVNLIIKDFSSDVIRCFGYVDNDTNASWAFDINPPNDNYTRLYKGCNQVINYMGDGMTFTPGATYRIHVEAYGKNSSGNYTFLTNSNNMYLQIPRQKCPPPTIIGVAQNDDYVGCGATAPEGFDVYVMYRINNAGTWTGGMLVPMSHLSPGDSVYFAVCSERSGWDDSDFIHVEPYKVKFKPSRFNGFNMKSGETMDYRMVGNTCYAYPVTATKWKEFCRVVNEFRVWRTYTEKTFYIPSRDDNFTAVIYNSVANAINDISGYGNQVPLVGNDNYITAWNFQILQDTLNNLL